MSKASILIILGILALAINIFIGIALIAYGFYIDHKELKKRWYKDD